MNVTVRWPRLSRAFAAAVVCACVLSVVLNNPAISIVAFFVSAAWLIAGVSIILRDGGFRPLRTVDLIEFNSLDQLNAYDMKQASMR